MMKALLLCLFASVLLTACDPNANNQVGRRPDFGSSNSGSTGGGSGTASSSTPTDAPLDGGLSVLLVAGAAYGIKRSRKNKSNKKDQ